MPRRCSPPSRSRNAFRSRAASATADSSRKPMRGRHAEKLRSAVTTCMSAACPRIPPWAGSMTRCCRASSAFPTRSSRGCCSTSSPTRWSTRATTPGSTNHSRWRWRRRGAPLAAGPGARSRVRRLPGRAGAQARAGGAGGGDAQAAWRRSTGATSRSRTSNASRPKSSRSCAPNTARSCPRSRTTPSSSRSRCTPSSCRRSNGCLHRRAAIFRPSTRAFASSPGRKKGPRAGAALGRLLHEIAMSTVLRKAGRSQSRSNQACRCGWAGRSSGSRIQSCTWQPSGMSATVSSFPAR